MESEFEKTKAVVAVFDKNAEYYFQKYMYFDLYHDTFDILCDSINDSESEVLDLACGPGNISFYIQQKCPSIGVTGIDLSPNMIRIAQENIPNGQFKVMDLRDISQLQRQFDLVIGGFCLPYLSKENTAQLIKDVSILLPQNGLFYLSTMEDDYTKSGNRQSSQGDTVFMYFHQADYLESMLINSGFQIIHLSRKDFQVAGAMPATDLIIIAQKK